MQDMARNNKMGSTERHWILGQEAKSINRGEVNSTHVCLSGAQTVAMDIRESWPHFLELAFFFFFFPRKAELVFFFFFFCQDIFLISYFEFPHNEQQNLPPVLEHPALLSVHPYPDIQPFTTVLQLTHVPWISSAFHFLTIWKVSVIVRPPRVISG